MGCKCNRVAPVIDPVPVKDVVIHEPRNQLIPNDSERKNKKKKRTTSLSDDDNEQLIDSLINSQNKRAINALATNNNFVEIEVADPQAFNNSFIEQRQQAIDNRSYRSTIDSWRPKTLQQLVGSIKSLSKNKSLIDCHWIIFYWITCNIEYDTVSYFTKNYADQSAEGVFRMKKGVCAGYGNIYKYLCDQLNLPCEIVDGYSKGYGFDSREGAPTETDHAWNAVQIDEHWYLIESTWGAGSLDDQKKFKRELETYYFFARPNEMIYHHLPENDKWQLLRQSVSMKQYMQMPKLRPSYFQFNLQLISPRHQAHIELLPGKSYALVLIRAPSDVHLIANLKLHDQKIDGGHRVVFDNKKQLYCCYFAPATIGKHTIIIYGKRGGLKTDTHSGALDLTLNVEQVPENPISFAETWKNFFDLGLKVISPKNTHLIKLHNGSTHAEILIRTPDDVALLGELVNSNGEKIEGGHQIFNDRHQGLWRCKFAPNRDGIFDAQILAKKNADTGSYTSAVSFKIEAKQIPIPPLSYPYTWQLFHDLDLSIEAPRERATALWSDNKSYAEVRVLASKDIKLLCDIEYSGVKEKNCALAQFDNDKQQWQLLFAPQHTGPHKLIIYAKRGSDTKTSFGAVAKLDLNVTKLRNPIQFPLTYDKFQSSRCRIYEPLNGVLKKGTIVPIHLVIPGATDVCLELDAGLINVKGYDDPIFKTEVTVGSNGVAIYAKYGQTTSYDGLVRYSTQ